MDNERPIGPGIRGYVLASRLRYVREKGGPEVRDRVLARLPVGDQSILRGWIQSATWYPFDLNQRLDDAIASELSPGDRRRVFLEMGRASAEANLLAGQRAFVKVGDPQGLLSAAPQIFAAYYAVGRREYEKTGPNSAALRTYDAESVSAEDCLTVIGWHVRAIELCGGRNVTVTETRCRTRGHPCCEYRCEWQL
ncbi:MAG TPA: TIGR02265 family protein [Anaeromyxobacter sp.]|nr:TIGR02265 family protein [Anaeromyxobacter sp.]